MTAARDELSSHSQSLARSVFAHCAKLLWPRGTTVGDCRSFLSEMEGEQKMGFSKAFWS